MRETEKVSPTVAAGVFLIAMLVLAIYCWSQVVRGLLRGKIRFAGNAPNTWQTRGYHRGSRTSAGFWLGIVAFTLGGLASTAGVVIAVALFAEAVR